MASFSSSSSSVVATRRKGGWIYDVYLSFRGEDTRHNFVDHLFSALQRVGIHTFKDDKMLGEGQPISQELVKAITESRFAVVVFSKKYANSSWCLDELSKIMECQDRMGGHQMKVLLVFYHVNPSDVRKQTGDYAKAFETHEDKFTGEEKDKVKKWRKALTAAAGLSGQHILRDHGGEVAFISKIVEEILANIQPHGGGGRENNLIGIEPRIDALISSLKMDTAEEVRIVGIWGMGGIGKTTIARALFNRITHKFEGSSFVADVRENSSSKKDMCILQGRILNSILGEHHGYKIEDRDEGAEIIQERCCKKKVLLVLDDVDNVKQLKFLAETREWFGPGSRIIITTRDQHVLSKVDVNYKPAILSEHQALELFSRHAFNARSPPEGYKELSIRAMHHAGGLPLALEVLGSFFCRREAHVWGSALNRLAKTQNDEIFETLKLSFDDLCVSEQKIFLDIACFYKGKDVERVTAILDSCGFDPVIGIRVLVEKSLITMSQNNTLDMHDLIQEMGRNEVQASAPNSRLWEFEKINNLIQMKMKNPNSWLWPLQKTHDLTENRELEVIEVIVQPRQGSKEGVSASVFKSMKKLRVLECSGKFTSCEPSLLPDELRWLCWTEYPFSSLPIAHMSKLVGLEILYGKIKYLWQEKKIMLQNLKVIHVISCKSLKRFPDVSGAQNIESLNFWGCDNMSEVDESIGSLKKLLHLNMNFCTKLKCLPSMLHMDSLKTLYLFDCSSLKRIPEFSPCMVNLSKLNMSGCSKIEKVSSSIKDLSSLTYLDMSRCYKLKFLPSIFHMKSLETLNLSYCHSLIRIPEFSPCMVNLSNIDISFCSKIEEVSSAIKYLSNLTDLSINGCTSLKNIPGQCLVGTNAKEEEESNAKNRLKIDASATSFYNRL